MNEEMQRLSARIAALEAEVERLRHPGAAVGDRVRALALTVRDLLEAADLPEPTRTKLLDAVTAVI